MQNSIIEKAEKFVLELLEKELDPKLTFHDVEHTQNVWSAVKTICALNNQLESDEVEQLELAALFHDAGYTRVYIGHEEESVKMARSFLLAHGYQEQKIDAIEKLILATKHRYLPNSLAEQVICDADMNHLSSKKYAKLMSNLKQERADFCGEHKSKEAWRIENINFLQNHKYFTKEAEGLYNKGKKKNLAIMTDQTNGKVVKKKKKGGGKNRNGTDTALASSKSAQMAFKTALRNHIDLTALADNKANIMLSVNAILITISIPYLPGYIRENPLLLIPAGILIITSMASVVTATLATRPIAMSGLSKADKIKTGAANLFFFGNFYKMKKEDYVSAISDVINDEEILEKSVISDLYHLGASLGDKYKTLRLCYTIFMIGMTLTVIAAMAVYMLTC